ncbi:MAG: trimethylamine methyltransferase family protein [Spirochaetes bacterium]|nr:trimethylamine methyltransferase family protein [Spirochaetota bacterium]
MAKYFGRGRGLEYLTEEEILNWHHQSLNLLEEVGVKITYEPALKLLKDAGCDVSKKEGIVRTPQHVAEKALRLAPSRFIMGGRDPSTDVIVGGNDVHTTGSGNCVNVIDLWNGEHRPGTFKDLEDMVILQDALDNLEVCQNPITPINLPKNGLYIKTFEGMIKNTGKHLMNQAESGVEVRDHVDMLSAVVGSREEVLKRKLVSFVCCFKSPLTYGDANCDVLFECSRLGLPLLIETDPISGATAPVTLAGLLIQQNAELLFANTLAQLVKPGTPVLYTHAPTVMDMWTGDVSEGCPERCLYYIYCAQMCRFYDIPSCGVSGVTDSKLNDLQSGLEKAATVITTALAGYNLIYSSAGTINSVLTSSLEGIVVDDELYSYVRRVLRGIDFSTETVQSSMDVIKKVAHSGKSFLTERHTKEYLRKEHWIPTIMDRRPYEVFAGSDKKGILDFARDKAKKILEEHKPVSMPQEAQNKIDEIVSRAQNR